MNLQISIFAHLEKFWDTDLRLRRTNINKAPSLIRPQTHNIHLSISEINQESHTPRNLNLLLIHLATSLDNLLRHLIHTLHGDGDPQCNTSFGGIIRMLSRREELLRVI